MNVFRGMVGDLYFVGMSPDDKVTPWTFLILSRDWKGPSMRPGECRWIASL